MIKRQFGVDDGLALNIVKRGVAPGGGGEISIKLPIAKELKNETFRSWRARDEISTPARRRNIVPTP